MPDKVWSQGDGLGRRMQEVAPGEYAEEVYVRDAWSAAVANGNAFLATSARVTTNVTNTHIRGMVANPAGSGVLITVMQVVSNIAPDAMVVGEVRLNPTTGLPVTSYTPLNLKALAGGTATFAGSFAVDAGGTALSGGTATELRLTTFKGRNVLAIGMPLAPGTSLGISIPLGLVSAGDGTFAAYMTQEAL